MLEHELLADKGVLIARPKGPLTAKDFAALAAEADAWIETHGALRGLVISAARFPGWENPAGMLAHFRFVRAHHRKIARVAVVSDSDLLGLMPGLANHFVAAELRRFKGDQEAEATRWVGG